MPRLSAFLSRRALLAATGAAGGVPAAPAIPRAAPLARLALMAERNPAILGSGLPDAGFYAL